MVAKTANTVTVWSVADLILEPIASSEAVLTDEEKEAGVALVGIDSLNIDDTADLSRPVHSLLLAAEIPIVEHLQGLGQLPGEGFRFFAVPVKVKNMGTFPVRAFGLVEEPA